MSRTVAAVDCGTNSIRLLILREEAGDVEELAREVRLARLGQGIDATGEFHPDALARAFAVFDEFATIIAAHGGAEVRVVATSAARDARNRTEFEDGVRARLGVAVDVVTGDEEAHLSATGVLAGVHSQRPTLVLDIGGGSTELIVIDEGDDLSRAVSLNMGAVRVRERFFQSDPPTPEEVARAREFVAGQLDSSGIEFEEIATAIGVAGTVTSVAARVLGLAEYRRDAVHATSLSRADIVAATEHWLSTPSDAIADEPCMHPLRAEVIGAGSMILDEISSRVPDGVIVSETDILDGIALSQLRG